LNCFHISLVFPSFPRFSFLTGAFLKRVLSVALELVVLTTWAPFLISLLRRPSGDNKGHPEASRIASQFLFFFFSPIRIFYFLVELTQFLPFFFFSSNWLVARAHGFELTLHVLNSGLSGFEALIASHRVSVFGWPLTGFCHHESFK
jgi:hypothetical protein